MYLEDAIKCNDIEKGLNYVVLKSTGFASMSITALLSLAELHQTYSSYYFQERKETWLFVERIEGCYSCKAYTTEVVKEHLSRRGISML